MLKHAVILAVLLGAFYFLVRDNIIYGPYIYDEADYMYAASLGFAANYIDSPSLSLPQFIRLGLSARRNPGNHTELSETIRASDDVVFYRHWHGPLYTDWLIVAKHFASSEHAMRAWNVVMPLATALLMYFGALWILPGIAGQIAAVLSAALYLWSYPAIRANELAPHQLFAFFTTLCLLLLARLTLTGERRDWYAAVAASALAFCTLEIAFALIATVLICGHLVRDRLKPDIAFAAKSAGVFLLTALLVWPGGILKLSFVRAYAFMAYLALFRKNAWGTNISVGGAWWLRIVLSPVPWILLALGALLLISRRLKWSPVLAPFAIFFVSMFLAVFRVNADAPRYALTIMPGLVLFASWAAGLWLTRFRTPIRAGAMALIMTAMLLTTVRGIRFYGFQREAPDAFALLNFIRQNHLTDKKMLAPHDDLPTIHYYFPHTRLAPYADVAEIPAQLQSGTFDGVLYTGDPPRYQAAPAVH